jgi:hypothetical protein
MEEFMQNGYKGKELRELNKCWLYLPCTNLADIANGKGDKLLTAGILCHRSPLIERCQFEWPSQPALNQSQQLLWRKALHKQCFTRHLRSTVLRQPLGTCYAPPNHLSIYDHHNRRYYILTDNRQWQQIQNKPLRLQQDPSWKIVQTISYEPRPGSIMKGTYTNGKFESLGTRSVQWQEKGDLDVQMRLDQLGELKWSVQNFQIQGNFDWLLQSIENGMAYSGTDGSYKDGHGTAAFRIQNDQGDKIIGCNITPGLQEHQSP